MTHVLPTPLAGRVNVMLRRRALPLERL